MSERKYRTPEQMIADLETKIASIRGRAERKRARQNPAVKNAIMAVKLLDKAMAATNDPTLRAAFQDARMTLSASVAVEGVILPGSAAENARPRGRRRAFQPQ